ncbi:DciA family protein [Streptacidiphilus sp. EB103A]|uniref:DciA family protein n=1 Tax=Streptacidiphilus sp. EB103A TaxID=3156275 RepID=UPI0035132035
MSESSGADLARIALAAAKKAAAERGADQSVKRVPKRRPATRHTGRDPIGLGSALGALMGDRGWQAPAAGGSVLDAWPTIAGRDLAVHVTAVAFEVTSGRLDLAADSGAWAFQTRLNMAQLIARANRAAGREVVRDIRVLSPGRARNQRPTTATATESREPVHLLPRPAVVPPTAYQLARQALREQRASRSPNPLVVAAAAREESSPHFHEPAHVMAEITARLHGLSDDHIPRILQETTRDQ